MEKRKLADVFSTVGLPKYTYVKPRYFGEVRADIEQPGKHLLIEGPSGIGKTCVVYKVFEELGWALDVDYSYVTARDQDAAERVNAFIKHVVAGETPSPSLIVVDDFHLLPQETRDGFGSILKRLSDRTFEQNNPPKAILIGIPTTGTALLAEANDLGPRLGSYRFKGASDGEINKLLDEGESALGVIFEDREYVLSESSQNFWLAQHIANKICATQEVFEQQDEVMILTFDLLAIRQRLMEELSQRYLGTATTFAKGKKWRPGGNKPYLDVLLALAKNPDLTVTYDKILNLVPERRRPGVKAVRSRIDEVIYDSSRNVDLRKQIAFSGHEFTIEDPLFRYFLSNMKEDSIYQQLGVEKDTVERARSYTYDVGFSFAGETRRIVELVNSELKGEDVLTFYDFDEQAVLLAEDLELLLEKVYSESCAYYLVFIDENYAIKAWTKFEKDIMTHSGRSGHIIPVTLDESGIKGVVGISSTVGRIDLREQWTELRTDRGPSEAVLGSIRNRCVIPILEKLSMKIAGTSTASLFEGSTSS
jgi:hypothetical protein